MSRARRGRSQSGFSGWGVSATGLPEWLLGMGRVRDGQAEAEARAKPHETAAEPTDAVLEHRIGHLGALTVRLGDAGHEPDAERHRCPPQGDQRERVAHRTRHFEVGLHDDHKRRHTGHPTDAVLEHRIGHLGALTVRLGDAGHEPDAERHRCPPQGDQRERVAHRTRHFEVGLHDDHKRRHTGHTERQHHELRQGPRADRGKVPASVHGGGYEHDDRQNGNGGHAPTVARSQRACTAEGMSTMTDRMATAMSPTPAVMMGRRRNGGTSATVRRSSGLLDTTPSSLQADS